MRNRFLGLLGVMLLAPMTAWPGTLDDSVVTLHLAGRTTKSACAPLPVDCTQYPTTGSLLTPYSAYLVVARGRAVPGVAGVSCGLYYDGTPRQGVDVFGWTLCGDLDFPNRGWPDAFSGNSVTWTTNNHCQRSEIGDEGVHAIAGELYVYAYGNDLLQITPNAPLGLLEVADCKARVTPLRHDAAGAIGFGGPGYNPCTGAGVLPDPAPDAPPPPPVPVPNGSLESAAVLLHIGDPTVRDACAALPADGSAVVTQAPIDPEAGYYVYVLASIETAGEGQGLSAVAFGLDYDATDLRIWSWSTCRGGSITTSDWPANGTGASMIFTGAECLGADLGAVGYFYVTPYAPSTLGIAAHPNEGYVGVADCALDVQQADFAVLPERIGWVSMGGGSKGADGDGCNPLEEPCAKSTTPVEATSWGRMKAMFADD